MVESTLPSREFDVAAAEFIPLYQRVIDDIVHKIDSGILRPGDRLPSTREMAAEYVVSPGTIREAITRLLERGKLRGHQGLGVFVAEP